MILGTWCIIDSYAKYLVVFWTTKYKLLRCLIYFLFQITPLYSIFCILRFSSVIMSIGFLHWGSPPNKECPRKRFEKTFLNVIVHISKDLNSELRDLCWKQRNKGICKKIRLPQKRSCSQCAFIGAVMSTEFRDCPKELLYWMPKLKMLLRMRLSRFKNEQYIPQLFTRKDAIPIPDRHRDKTL